MTCTKYRKMLFTYEYKNFYDYLKQLFSQFTTTHDPAKYKASLSGENGVRKEHLETFPYYKCFKVWHINMAHFYENSVEVANLGI